MTVRQDDTDQQSWSCDDRLDHCKGFRVDGPGGRVGVVEAVLGHQDKPTTLAVREGLFALRTIHVPLERAPEVRPRAERIVVRSCPEPGS